MVPTGQNETEDKERMIATMLAFGRHLRLIGMRSEVAIDLTALEDMREQADKLLEDAVDGFADTPIPKMFYAEIDRARELIGQGKVFSASRFVSDAQDRLRFIQLNYRVPINALVPN